MTVLRHDDQRGGLAYPFLPDDQPWQIVTRSFDDEAALARILRAADPETGTEPALRWVKDDKVLDLYFPGLDTPAFLARSGLSRREVLAALIACLFLFAFVLSSGAVGLPASAIVMGMVVGRVLKGTRSPAI